MIKGIIEIRSDISKNIINSITPDEFENKRAKTEFELKNKKIIMKIEAKDVVAFRAMLNTQLKLVNTLEKIKKVIE